MNFPYIIHRGLFNSKTSTLILNLNPSFFPIMSNILPQENLESQDDHHQETPQMSFQPFPNPPHYYNSYSQETNIHSFLELLSANTTATTQGLLHDNHMQFPFLESGGGGGGANQFVSQEEVAVATVATEANKEKMVCGGGEAGSGGGGGRKKKGGGSSVPKVVFETKSPDDILDDGYRWRKYGQKSVKNSKYPRSYYRCSHHTCIVKKQVQRLSKDTSIVVTSYEGVHNHPCEKLMETLSPLLNQIHLLTRF